MAKNIEKWLKEDYKRISRYSISKISNEKFFRDPVRPIYVDNDYFFAPADGMILYQKEVNSDEAIVEIKGRNFTLKDLLQDNDFNQRCLVIGTFMTFYDVHVNRIPYGGFLKWEDLDVIQTYNVPMMQVEKGLFDGYINFNGMEYLFTNARRYNEIYVPKLDYTYYVVQIADDEVDVILHFTNNQMDNLKQNERFSFIRWGSQVELILPIDERFSFETIIPDLYHVEAGVDKLVKIIK